MSTPRKNRTISFLRIFVALWTIDLIAGFSYFYAFNGFNYFLLFVVACSIPIAVSAWAYAEEVDLPYRRAWVFVSNLSLVIVFFYVAARIFEVAELLFNEEDVLSSVSDFEVFMKIFASIFTLSGIYLSYLYGARKE